MHKKLEELKLFFNQTIWQIDTTSLSPVRVQWYKQLRIVIIAIKRYLKKEGNLSASALTFFSLLSIVPVLAMAFGIAKGFGIDEILEKQVRQNLYGQGELTERLIEFSKSMLETTNGGVVAGIGFILVFYSVLKLLNSIENAFNKAWDIEKPRSFYRKFTDYTSFIVVAPVLFTVSSSISVFVISGIEDFTKQINVFGIVEIIVTLGLDLLSFTLIWLLMILIYMLLPNTKVKWSAAIQGGIVIGSIFIITQWIYVNFQIGATRANAIYGSFAALPLFLAWLQVSWFIVIFGASYTFAIQNEKMHRNIFPTENLSDYSIKKISLLITQLIVKDFSEAKAPTKESFIAEKLQLPIKVIHDIVNMLLKAKVITKVQNNTERNFQPAMDIHKLTISNVLKMLEDQETINQELYHLKADKEIDNALSSYKEVQVNETGNVLLVNL